MSVAISESLSLINKELLATLLEARQVLESYVDSEGGDVDLSRCCELLHSAAGALQMVEAHGACLLAEEMEKTCRQLAENGSQGPSDQRVEALTRAIVQLPAYVETIVASGRDIPLVLLPLLNDLRAARGKPLLSESTLLLLDNGVAPGEVPNVSQPSPNGEDIVAIAKSGRTRFQLGLLGWIKGASGTAELHSMRAVALKLEQSASTPETYQLWWVVGGVIEALEDGGLETSVALKRLMGQADREIKRLAQLGEAEYSAAPPTDLLNNLLYYVARAKSDGPQVTAIREAFNLNTLVPGEEQVEQLRQALAAPSANLMRTVADAIRQDLANAKDVLDIYVRTGMDSAQELEPQVDMLRKISDTLGVLGLAGLRDVVGKRSEELREIVQQGSAPEEAKLVELAAALLSVEDQLDEELIALVDPGQPGDAEDELEVDVDGDYQQVVQSVMRECVVNIARIKEAINSVMGQPGDRSNVDELDVLINGITAGLAMLGQERALMLVEKAGGHIVGFVRLGDQHRPLENLNRLADAIVSIEYYMETIQNGRKPPDYMLDNAERCLSAMDEAPEPAATPVADGEHDATMKIDATEVLQQPDGGTHILETPGDIAAGADGVVDKTAVLEQPDLALPGESQQAAGEAEKTSIIETLPAESTEVLPKLEELGEVAAQATVEMPALDVVKTGDDAPDPELLEIFLEEAKECVETIQREFPVWEQDHKAEDELTTVRRSYHTLKGSGRMVGAELIGEFAWSVENLFNKIINNTLEVSGDVMALLHSAVEATPELVEQLESGVAPQADVATIIHNAHGYAEEGASFQPVPLAGAATDAADDSAADETVELLPESELFAGGEATVTPEASAPEPAMDPVLLDILQKESSAHFATLREFVDDCRLSAPPFAVTKDVYRACHTLQGSMTMADAGPAIGLAEALNQMVQHAKEQSALLSRDGIDAIADAADALESVVNWLGAPQGEAPANESVIDALNRVREDIPTQSAIAGPEDISSAQDDEPAVVSGFDPEIAAIFAEEAAEILDAADSSLVHMSNDPEDPGPLAELLRHLHTLKGGARMAGVTPIGDFSHDLEDYLGKVSEGVRTLDRDAVRVLQSGFDELQRMRDEVPGGQVAPVSQQLQADLQVLIDGSAAPVVGTEVGYGDDLTVDMPVPPEVYQQQEESDDSAPAVGEVADAVEEQEEVAEVSDDETVEVPVTPVDTAMDNRLGELAEAFKKPADQSEGTDIVAALGIGGAEPATDSAAGAGSEEDNQFDEAADAAAGQLLEQADLGAPGAQPAARDFTRVDSGVLEEMLNSAGEISIFHSRLNQQLGLIQFNLEELGSTVTRLREQLRAMDMETEAQILHGHKAEGSDKEEFDPLELDRYSAIQQLSRALAESSNDVSSIRDLLQNLSRETESLLGQQARTVAELQDNLMRTRMVPFQQHVPRLSRLVRQTANEEGKQIDLKIQGASGELDRQVLEKMLPPFEHMLRNAVIHGIESPEQRRAAGKDETGHISVQLRREGSEVIIEVSDDGAGLNVEDIRDQASQQGDLSDTQVISDEAAMRLILRSGLTTAKQITQSAGRGIGMDVVVNEVAKLGGTLGINSEPGKGCIFTVRLPYTLAVVQALIVQISEETYALPMTSIEGVIRVPREEFDGYISRPVPEIEYGSTTYSFRHLGHYLGMPDAGMPQDTEFVSIILVKTDEEAVALLTDKTVDSREIVVKPVGSQLATVRGVSGATILGDGSIVIILDVSVLVRSMPMTADSTPLITDAEVRHVPLAMVVDDSITMRRVSQRLLERHGLRVVTATDGVHALEVIEDEIPDVILLDIEMPRMDGYEFASKLRNSPDTVKVPIIMVTSRSGEKHRARAIELGVNDYLGKPYQEQEMLEAVRSLLGDKAPADL